MTEIEGMRELFTEAGLEETINNIENKLYKEDKKWINEK